MALHGGGMNAAYFHGEALPELFLLTIGAAAGWNVLALDRPGYGASAGLPAELCLLRAQADLVFRALDTFALSHDVGAGFLLCGHSYGLKLSIHLGGHARGGELLGLDGSGAGRRYRPERTRRVAEGTRQLSRQDAIRLFWGPPELYPPGTFRPGRGLIEPVPATENREAAAWPDEFPALAAAVRIPVRLTFAEHENWWVCDDAELAAIAGAFAAAPSVETARQPGAGHNISLGWAALPYHLAALAFAERCLLRARGDTPPKETW
nr:alpha/beta fold hydrolase [Pseudofrankia sp. BMG5.36]